MIVNWHAQVTKGQKRPQERHSADRDRGQVAIFCRALMCRILMPTSANSAWIGVPETRRA